MRTTTTITMWSIGVAPIGKQSIMTNTLTWTMVRASMTYMVALMAAASNYDPMATIDDGSCEPEPEPIEGCTDSDAENYDPEAEIDDGSCEYEEEPSVEDCSVAIENHYRGHANNDQYSDTMIVAFKVVPTNCDDFIIDVVIEAIQTWRATSI